MGKNKKEKGKSGQNEQTQSDRERENHFERRYNTDGSPNSKYVDLLDVDPPIAGQSFCLLSFLSPEKVLKQKEIFFFEAFLKNWDFSKSMEKFAQFLNFVSYKYKINFEDVMKDFEEFVKEERANLVNNTVEDEYKTFLDKNEERLEKDFNVAHNFQTSTRGIKFRGAFPSQGEAELRSKLLRERDPHHDIYTGECGVWMPWDPDAYKTGRVEYMEEELNQLAHNKSQNEANAKTAFEQRIKETRQKAMEENIKKAEKSGNVLTQTLDAEGKLVNIANMNTQERALKEKMSNDTDYEHISVANIRNELFEGDNIVVGKTDNGVSKLHGLNK
jgi:hypothetical protein